MRYVPEDERDSESNSLWDLPYVNGHENNGDVPDDPTNSSGITPDSSDEQVQNGAGMVRPRRPSSPQPPFNQPYLFGNDYPQPFVTEGYVQTIENRFVAQNPVHHGDMANVPNFENNAGYPLTNGDVRNTSPSRPAAVEGSLLWPDHSIHVPSVAVNVPTRRTHRRLFRRGANPSWFGTSAFSQTNVSTNRRSRQHHATGPPNNRARSPSRIPVLLDNLPSTSSDPGAGSNFNYVDYLENLPSYAEYTADSVMSNPEVARFIRPPSLYDIETTSERLHRETRSNLGGLEDVNVVQTPIENPPPTPESIAQNRNDHFPEQFQLSYGLQDPSNEEPVAVQITPITPPSTPLFPVNYSLRPLMESQSMESQSILQLDDVEAELQEDNSAPHDSILSPSIFSTNQSESPVNSQAIISSLNEISDNSIRSASAMSNTSGMSRLSRDISNLDSDGSDTIDDISDKSTDDISSDSESDEEESRPSTPESKTFDENDMPTEELEPIVDGTKLDDDDIANKVDEEIADCMKKMLFPSDGEIPGPSALSLDPPPEAEPVTNVIPLRAQLAINGKTVVESGKCSLSFDSLSSEDFKNMMSQDMDISISIDDDSGEPFLIFSVKPEEQDTSDNGVKPIYRHISRYLCGEVLEGHTKRVKFNEVLTEEHIFQRDPEEITVLSSSEEAEAQDMNSNTSDDSDSEIPDIEDCEFS